MNKQHFYAFLTAVANYYKVPVDSVLRGESFSLEAPKAALLGENIQQRSDFLKQINMVQVTDIKGNKLFGATEKAITGRKSEGRHLAKLNHTQGKYELAETDAGVIVPWAMFDQFARLNNAGQLFDLYAEYVQTQIALDILQVGFHGKSVAEDTSASDLSDVNLGWLFQLERDKSANVLTGSTIYGNGDDFSTLDDVALELKQALDYRHQNRNDLVFLVGADLANAEARYVTKEAKLKPSERVALGSNVLFGSFGGMQAITPPNFPAKSAAVTTLKNLSVYTQDSSVRRRFESNEDQKGIIDSYYRQEGYVVEDNGLMTLVKDLTINKPNE
ncbi:phage major capsid protein, P2 family [Mannheimia haemolytica]